MDIEKQIKLLRKKNENLEHENKLLIIDLEKYKDEVNQFKKKSGELQEMQKELFDTLAQIKVKKIELNYYINGLKEVRLSLNSIRDNLSNATIDDLIQDKRMSFKDKIFKLLKIKY